MPPWATNNVDHDDRGSWSLPVRLLVADLIVLNWPLLAPNGPY